MRLVIATTADDLMGDIFWGAYRDAGGISPTSVFLIAPRRDRKMMRAAIEGVMLFGPIGALRSWQAGRSWRDVLLRDPDRIFPGSEIVHTASLNRGEGLDHLKRIGATLFVSVGSPEIFKGSVLTLPTVGAVNVHNGRLPAYRGLFGTFWEMRFGEAVGWISIHQMVPRVDAGPVLAEATVALGRRPLLAALQAKKRDGGRLLARFVNYVQQQGMLPPAGVNGAEASMYYGWPSWGDLIALRLSALRQRIVGVGMTGEWDVPDSVTSMCDPRGRGI